MKFISALIAFSAVAALAQAGSMDTVTSTAEKVQDVAGSLIQKRALFRGVTQGLSPEGVSVTQPIAVAKRDVNAHVDVK
ncbi:hypothetical protein BGZ90_009801, partial [Linnemannia elongata]